MDFDIVGMFRSAWSAVTNLKQDLGKLAEKQEYLITTLQQTFRLKEYTSYKQLQYIAEMIARARLINLEAKQNVDTFDITSQISLSVSHNQIKSRIIKSIDQLEKAISTLKSKHGESFVASVVMKKKEVPLNMEEPSLLKQDLKVGQTEYLKTLPNRSWADMPTTMKQSLFEYMEGLSSVGICQSKNHYNFVLMMSLAQPEEIVSNLKQQEKKKMSFVRQLTIKSQSNSDKILQFNRSYVRPIYEIFRNRNKQIDMISSKINHFELFLRVTKKTRQNNYPSQCFDDTQSSCSSTDQQIRNKTINSLKGASLESAKNKQQKSEKQNDENVNRLQQDSRFKHFSDKAPPEVGYDASIMDLVQSEYLDSKLVLKNFSPHGTFIRRKGKQNLIHVNDQFELNHQDRIIPLLVKPERVKPLLALEIKLCFYSGEVIKL